MLDELPAHNNLQIDHNPHAAVEMAAGSYLDDEHRIFGAAFTAEDYAQMVSTDEIWVIRWSTEPIVPDDRSRAVYAATLERALELANATDTKSD